MSPPPVVTGLSPKEGPPGTRVTIRGENLGKKQNDLIGLSICGCDCLLSAEWKSPNKIIARTGACKGKGDILVTTLSGGVGTSTVQFRAYHETIGPMKESAVWVEESPMQSLAWGRRSHAPSGYTQDDPLGLSIEGNDKKFPEDLRDMFPECSGDLSHDAFSPAWFLLENHHGTSFDDLKAGLSYLRRKVESQKEGQLSFLKSNAGSVIDQLDTLMMLRDKFQADMQQGNAGEQLVNLERAIQKSIKESHNLFNDVLKRREKADSTRAALSALSRHRFLFCLANSIEKCAVKNEFDIIVNDYARAKNLFGKTEVAIFRKVLDEVDMKILIIRKSLHNKVREMPQGVEQQKKLVKALINLEIQQLGSSVANKMSIDDPAWDAIEARAKYLDNTFKQTYEQYLAKEGQMAGGKGTRSGDTNTVPNRVLFCEEMTEVAGSQFPDLWRLGQAYFTGELRGVNEPKPGNFKRIILNSIEQFCSCLRAALVPVNQKSALAMTMGSGANAMPPWPSTSSAINQFIPWLPNCLRYARVSYASLIRLDLPNEALDIVLKLIDELRLYCLSTIFKKANDKIKKIADRETWEILAVTEYPGATLLPSKLEEIFVDALEDAQTTCLLPEIREGPLLEPQSDGQREISKRVQEILNTFCDELERLALERTDEEVQQAPTISQLIGFPSEMLQQNSIVGEKDWGSLLSWEQRLLCCLSNCAYCNKIFFPRIGSIFTKYGYPVPTLAIENSRSTVNTVFVSLLEVYVEHKSDPLVGTVEPSMYIGSFQWNTVNTVGKLSPYAHECCDNLVGVYSEIFSISPSLLRPILEPIVQTVAEELARLMTCVQKFNAHGALQANTDIRLIRDAVQVYSNETAKSFFAEALEAVPALSVDGNRQVESILQKIKQDMRLQIMCLKVVDL